MSRLSRCDHCGAPLPIEAGATEIRCAFCMTRTVVANVPESVVRPKHVHVATHRAGDAVLVEWSGRYWPAHVLAAVGEGAYRIHYDGYSSSWDEVVGPDRIEPRAATVPRTATASIVVGVVAAVIVLVVAVGVVLVAIVTRGGPVQERSSATVVASGGSYVPGQSVDVLWHDRWYEGTVLREVAGGLVRIHYVGWDESWDEDVTRDRIRAR